MELLAPGGSYEALLAAVQSGADAVYIGGSRFSARGNAHNFDDEQMREWVKYCHIRGVSVHVAANTLIKENEVNDFLEYIGLLNNIGVDAVITQDIGMASVVHKIYPELPIHASTQMTCASVESAKYLSKMGFSRIVLARELDFEAIKKIKNSVDAEIEIFIHGAICMSYSGQCLMSSMIGGRSGNRGHCAQPCRLPYKFEQNGKNVNSGYLLSPKDMCLVNYMKELNDIGIDSLKIEGRLKRPEYVSAVVGVYRKCIDEIRKATKEEKTELLNAFNRSGFTDGYFTKKHDSNMMSYNDPSNISENKFTEEAKNRCRENNELKKIPIKIFAKLEKGKPLQLTVSDYDNYVTVEGNVICEKAENVSMTEERLNIQLSKLGNTPYMAVESEIFIDEGITLSISEINNVRRQAIEELSNARSKTKIRKKETIKDEIINIPVEENRLCASVMNCEQALVCIEKGIKRIYAPAKVISELKDKYSNIEYIQILSPISKEGKSNEKIIADKVSVSSVGQIKDNKYKIFGDYRLNVTNSHSVEFFKNFECVTLSAELTINEIKKIKKPCDTEIIVYGRIPLMTFENCPVKANGKCDGGKSENALIDRMGERFPLICASGCFGVLLNSKPIFMADKAEDLKQTGAKYFRMNFTIESEKETRRIVDKYIDSLNGNSVKGEKENTFTRGHFYKPTLEK